MLQPVEEDDDTPTRRMRAVPERWWENPRLPLLVGAMSVAMLAGALTWSGLERLLQPGEVPAAAPSPVTLTVRTLPEGARVIRADTGEALGVTPLVKELPRSDASMGLRVELAGYVSQEREVRLDSPTVLEVDLAQAKLDLPPPAPVKEAPRQEEKRDALIDPFAQ